jgi:putative transposase
MKKKAEHHRRSIRLKGYDYAQPGGYFVTIVTNQRECLFGEIIDKEMRLNPYGRVVEECWGSICEHFQNVELGAFIVMPNHIHGIIFIRGAGEIGARHASPLPSHGTSPRSLGTIVGSFKSAVTRRLGREFRKANIWQRNYYEHVIRNETEWDKIHRYIESNPAKWESDQENLPRH